ncbi:MAG: sulfite exporter TauE/SafE family protein [Armatimonadota bacterium]
MIGPVPLAELFAAAFLAGGVNAVAGGGTLLTFPALLSLGFPATIANATSTVALFPGQISALAALRAHLAGARSLAPVLVAIGTVGGLLGAWLLTRTPVRIFEKVVPFLILGATVIFLVQEPLARRSRSGDGEIERIRWSPGVLVLLAVVAVYGGYFGAGIGILTLAALGMMGLRDMHRMNAVKALFTLGANGVASAWFLMRGLADPGAVAPMLLGTTLGGYAGARLGQRVGKANVRRIVVGIGLVLGAVQMVKAFR